MRVLQHLPMTIGCDNRSAIQIAHNDVFHEQTKHIKIDCHFCSLTRSRNTLWLLPITSEEQPADLFTKVHSPSRFYDFLSKLKITSHLPH